MRQIILASSSPRRAELLSKIGLKFKIIPSEIEERIDPSLSAKENTKRLSRLKALAVAQKVSKALVIAADSLVVLKGKFLGKPKNIKEARQMLRGLSGRKHQVATAITVLDTETKKLEQRVAITKVKFKVLDQKVINQYLSEVDPLDKAGAYAIQENGEMLVESIEGDYCNVMGLPLETLISLL